MVEKIKLLGLSMRPRVLVWLWVLTALALCVSVVHCRVHYCAESPLANLLDILPTPEAESQRTSFAQLGPWGELIQREMFLSPPDSLLQPDRYLLGNPEWAVPAASLADLAAQLSAMGVATGDAARLCGAAATNPAIRGFSLFPPPDIIRGLADSTRRTLYGYLGQSGLNTYYNDPFLITSSKLARWRAGSAAQARVVQRLMPYLYRAGEYSLFSDPATLLQELDHPEDRRQALTLLHQQQAVMLVVRIMPETNIDQMVGYWGAGGREEEIRLILEAFQASGGGGMDVVQLLPSFARERVNRFPAADENPRHDCHWSAMNFFREDPYVEYATPDAMLKEVLAEYQFVASDYRLGDLILLRNRQGLVLHSCVHIAGQVVFTKNGMSRLAPWVFMELPEVVARYAGHGDLDLRVMRRRS